MFSNKSNMQKALSVMGASASSNHRKAELATVIVDHLTTNAEYIWYTLSESTRKNAKSAEMIRFRFITLLPSNDYFLKDSYFILFFP